MSNRSNIIDVYREAFIEHAQKMIGYTEKKTVEKYSSLFGCSALICAIIWQRVVAHFFPLFLHKKTSPKHLLWMLYYINHYPTEDAMEAIFHADRKTIRTWIWYMLERVAQLVHTEVSTKMFSSMLILITLCLSLLLYIF